MWILGHGGPLCQEHLMNQDDMMDGGALRPITKVITVIRLPGPDGATDCGEEL